MKYLDGDLIRVGDEVLIDGQHRGQVVASMDTSTYLPGEQSWAYLKEGIIVRTDFAGLVHYTAGATDLLELARRLA